MTDYALLACYILLCLTSIFGGVLCVWWWRRNVWNASKMYIYLTFLLFAIGIRNIIDMLIFWDRVLFPGTPNHFLWLWDSWLWPFRIIFLLIVTSFIVWHMAFRIFFNQRYIIKNAKDQDENQQEMLRTSEGIRVSLIKGIKDFNIFRSLVEKHWKRKEKNS